MLACALLGYGVSFLNLTPRQTIQSKWQLLKVTLLAFVFCITVVLGNISLRFIPVSFNQVLHLPLPFSIPKGCLRAGMISLSCQCPPHFSPNFSFKVCTIVVQLLLAFFPCLCSLPLALQDLHLQSTGFRKF